MASIALELNWQNFAHELDGDVRTALVRSINRVSDRARTRASRAVQDQVNFPASYLSPSADRLSVKRRAKPDELSAVISGQDRPTSLARFSKQKVGEKRGQGVAVSLKRGGARKIIRRAFLLNLSNGNVGLAVRTDGEQPAGAWKAKEIAQNLYLLYGASIDQVLMSAGDGGGVFEEIEPEMLDLLEAEFARQLQLQRGQDA